MIRLIIPVLAMTWSALPALASGKETCGETPKWGTAIQWLPSIEEAARKAGEDDKLVLVLHVSGVFSDPALT